MTGVRRRRLLALWLALPVVLVAGIWLGGHPDSLPGPVRDTLVGKSDGAYYDEALDLIARDYYRKVDRDTLLDKSLSSVVSELERRTGDRFSAYFGPREYGTLRSALSGRFEGVGMTVQEAEEGLRIVRVFPRSPAAKVGLESGDVISAVNGRSLAGRTSQQATALIKGKAGTSVTLKVKTGDRPTRDVEVERADVDVPVVESRMEKAGGRKIGWVQLSSFTSGAHGEVAAAVRKRLREGAKGIVLDLRDNGGGLLNEAVMTSSLFVSDGPIVSTKGRTRPRKVYQATGSPISTTVPVAVLVNRRSASASEIVTAALQDKGRAKVVGETTYGKGVFQQVEPLSNGGALELTVGEFFTPKGRNLGGRGVPPDVKAVDKASTRDRDEALDAALDVLAAGRT